jgi:shikimate dehydrogenase
VASGVRQLSQAGRRSIRAAVLGSPVGHSLSPVLHRAAYQALGLTWWRYDAIECDEAGLPALLDRCGPDWAGLSLTMPLKRAVIPLLDRIDPLVTQVGGANTVLLVAEQRLGYNTDVGGMVRALGEHGITKPEAAGSAEAAVAPRDAVGPAVIAGGGATACAALAALRDLGERSATAAMRDPARSGELLAAAGRLGMAVEVRPLEAASLAAGRLIISTVPSAASDFMAEQIRLLDQPPRAVFDVVYHPWPTPLARAAAQAGAVVVGGFDLLLHQAALQVELMTGRPAPAAEMRRAGLAELARRSQKQ